MLRPVTSASSIFRRKACPGSERIESGLPEESTEQAEEGTLLHEYDANPSLARECLSREHQRLLALSAELDRKIFAIVEEKLSAPAGEPYEEGRERKLVALRGTPYETVGHCDLWRVYPSLSVSVVIDKKFGYTEVTPASANYQLRTYAIAAREEWMSEQVFVAISQPRLSAERRLTMSRYTSEDLDAAAAELQSIRAAAMREDAPLNPGEEQCRYCKGKVCCPAYRQQVESVLSLVPSGDRSIEREGIGPAVARCDDDQIDRLLRCIRFAEFIAEAVKEEARKRVGEGRLAGWCLKDPINIRRVTDVPRAIGLLSQAGLCTLDDALKCASLDIRKLEERVRERQKCTWNKARESVDDALASVIEFTPRKPVLKPRET